MENKNIECSLTEDYQLDSQDEIPEVGHTPALPMPNMEGLTPAMAMPTYPVQAERDCNYNNMERTYCMHMYMAYMQKAEAYKHKMLYYGDCGYNRPNGGCNCY